MSSNYFEIVTEQASSSAYDPASPFRDALLSAEGHHALSVPNMFSYARDHAQQFFRRLERLTPEQREMMIEYFVLRKTQAQIAALHGYASQGGGVSEELTTAVGIVLGKEAKKLPKIQSSIKRKRRARRLRFKDHRILGDFHVNIGSGGATALFASRALQVSNAAAL